MNFSITGPDFDVIQQRGSQYSISSIFGNTVRMISKCYKEIKGDKDLLSVFKESGLFDPNEIPVETYRGELVAATEAGTAIHQVSIKPPKAVWKRFHQLLSTLNLNLEGGLLEAFLQYDWALFAVDLYANTCLKDLYEKGTLPDDIRKSYVLLPLKNAYVKLKYKHDGKVARKRNWLTLERGPTYLVISYAGMACPVTRKDFDFLKGCGYRMSFPEFYKKASGFVEKPQDFLDRLLGQGLILFAPADLG
jgi:hypothetical protein